MALRVKVCRTGDVAPGQTRAFEVPGVTVPILVANIDGEHVATSSMCPHEDVSLAGCKLRGSTVFCRGHGYRFDLLTGACSHDPNLHLRRYRITTVGDELYVDLL